MSTVSRYRVIVANNAQRDHVLPRRYLSHLTFTTTISLSVQLSYHVAYQTILSRSVNWRISLHLLSLHTSAVLLAGTSVIKKSLSATACSFVPAGAAGTVEVENKIPTLIVIVDSIIYSKESFKDVCWSFCIYSAVVCWPTVHPFRSEIHPSSAFLSCGALLLDKIYLTLLSTLVLYWLLFSCIVLCSITYNTAFKAPNGGPLKPVRTSYSRNISESFYYITMNYACWRAYWFWEYFSHNYSSKSTFDHMCHDPLNPVPFRPSFCYWNYISFIYCLIHAIPLALLLSFAPLDCSRLCARSTSSATVHPAGEMLVKLQVKWSEVEVFILHV